MNYSYRYLRPEASTLESSEILQKRSFDVEKNLSKLDYDLNAFGMQDIGTDRLLEIRTDVFKALGGNASDRQIPTMTDSRFDFLLTRHILSIFHDLTPYEAGQKPVWAYLTLRLLPDVAIFRFPMNALERYLGEERNVFRRMWQRASILGEDLAAQLQEDEHIKIFERGQSLGSNRFFAKCLAEKAIVMRSSAALAGDTNKSSKIMSEAAKNLRRSLSVLNLQAMPEERIRELIDQEMDRAKARLGGNI